MLIYMEVLEGLQYFENIDPSKEYLKLKQTIYGTVQAARQWFKYFIRELQDKVGFKQARAEPCLLVKRTDKGVVILCVYVDNACLFGPRKSVLKTKEEIALLFKVKDVGALQEYVSITVERPNQGELLLSQPDIIARVD